MIYRLMTYKTISNTCYAILMLILDKIWSVQTLQLDMCLNLMMDVLIMNLHYQN